MSATDFWLSFNSGIVFSIYSGPSGQPRLQITTIGATTIGMSDEDLKVIEARVRKIRRELKERTAAWENSRREDVASFPTEAPSGIDRHTPCGTTWVFNGVLLKCDVLGAHLMHWNNDWKVFSSSPGEGGDES